MGIRFLGRMKIPWENIDENESKEGNVSYTVWNI